MAITSYSELQTAAANWLARADLTSRIPEFIVLAEAKFNRTLRVREMIVRDPAFSINAEYVQIPTGFLEVVSLKLNASPRISVTFMPEETQNTLYSSASGKPIFFDIVGSMFRFAPVPDATYSATIVYYKAITALASTTPNWLLTSHPDIYLYGTLLESAPFLGADDRLGMWASALDRCVGQLKTQSARANTANGMMIRVA